jgi:hypothetical protein
VCKVNIPFLLVAQDFDAYQVLNKCMRNFGTDSNYKPQIKTKGFYSKNAKYKKKK